MVSTAALPPIYLTVRYRMDQTKITLDSLYIKRFRLMYFSLVYKAKNL